MYSLPDIPMLPFIDTSSPICKSQTSHTPKQKIYLLCDSLLSLLSSNADYILNSRWVLLWCMFMPSITLYFGIILENFMGLSCSSFKSKVFKCMGHVPCLLNNIYQYVASCLHTTSQKTDNWRSGCYGESFKRIGGIFKEDFKWHSFVHHAFLLSPVCLMTLSYVLSRKLCILLKQLKGLLFFPSLFFKSILCTHINNKTYMYIMYIVS